MADLIAGVCKIVTNRIDSGEYSKLVASVHLPPKALFQWPQRKLSLRADQVAAPDFDEETRQKRLDMKALMDFHQKHGASKLLLMKPASLL